MWTTTPWFLRAGAARVLEALRSVKREVAKTGY